MPNEFPQDIAALNAIEDRAAEIKALMPTALNADGGLKVHIQNGGDVGGGGEGGATEDKQDAGNDSLASLDGKLTTLLTQTDGLEGFIDGIEALLASLVPPENTEVVALASALDTTAGRTSADLVNKHGSAIVFFFEATAKEGSGTLSALVVEGKFGSVYRQIVEFDLSSLDLGTLPVRGLYSVAPTELSGGITTSMVSRVPRNYRVRVNAATDGEGNTVTYSVINGHLL